MSKIEKYNKHMYPNIKCALQELMKLHLRDHKALGSVYTKKAYEEIAAFLCANNIDHTFIVHKENDRFGVRLVVVCWKGALGEENLGWWEVK